MLIFILLIVILISLVAWWFKKKFSYWRDRNVLYLEPKFPWGNLKGVGQTVHWVERITEVYTKFKGKDKICGFYMMISPQVMLLDLDLIKTITIKDFNNFVDRGMYYHEKADPLSAHLFNIEGDKWRNLRNKLSPTFTSSKMKMMFGTVMDVTNDLKKLLTSYAEQKVVVDAKDLCVRYTADVIGSCAFGLECNNLKSENPELLAVAKKLFDFKSPGRQIKMFFQQSFIELSRKLNLRQFDEESEKYFMGIIRDTINFRETNQVKRNDFMNLLLQIQKHGKLQDDVGAEHVGTMTFNEMAAQAFVFFFAGFETSSTTMNFCLYELAYNQEIQNKVRDEVQEVLIKYDGKLTYEGMTELHYMEQVINETLRKFCPISALSRRAINDYTIPGTSHIIEKNTHILIPVYSIHYDPDIYPNPTMFDPERFTLENIKERHPYSFLPFGEGPRNCIGMRFAILQMKVGLANMITNFQIELNSKTSVPIALDETDIMMSPKGGIWLDLKKIS